MRHVHARDGLIGVISVTVVRRLSFYLKKDAAAKSIGPRKVAVDNKKGLLLREKLII